MSDLWKEGFRGSLYLLDDAVEVPIDSLDIQETPVEVLQHLANVAQVANRPKWSRSAIPSDKVVKHTFTLRTDSGLSTEALRQVARVKTYPRLVPICPWVPRVVEWFTYPATVAGKKPITWRQNAISGVPAGFQPVGAATDYAPIMRKNGVVGTAPAASGSPNTYGHQQWTITGSFATDDAIEIEYTPMFLCWVLPASESLPGEFRHAHQLVLVEV